MMAPAISLRRLSRLSGTAALVMSLSACLQSVNQPTAQIAAAPRRDLTQTEKLAIGAAIARKMKDPDSVKFLWMPVALIEENGNTRYCGLINGRNSYGGFTGYTRFYAHLRKGEKGQLTSAELRAMEEPNRQANPLDPRWLNGICEKYGYENFDLAK